MPRLLSSVSLVVVLAVTISGAAVRAQQAAPPAGPAAIRPTENLIVEGIPEIPAGLADEVRRYTEARSAAFVGWHPTRVEMLIGTRFGNTAQIHEVRMPGGARRQLTFFAEPIGAADWDPKEGKFFLFTRDTGGNEFGQMYRLDVASGDVTLLSDGSRSQNGGWVWDRAGDRIAYTSTRRNGADRDIWVVDPRDPATDRLVVENAGGGWSVLDWSPDGTHLLVGESLSVNKSRRWLVDVASGAKTRLDDDGPEDVAWGGGTFTPDGGAIWTTTDKDSEFARLVRWTPASGGIEVMAADIPWEVEAFDVSEDGKSVCFITNEAGVSRARVLDTATGKHRLVAGLPDGVIAAGEWHADGRHLAFSVGSARSTSDVYVWDAVEGGPAIRWTESELGGLVADTLVEPRAIDWQSFDGLEIRGFLYPAAPRFTGRRPVIINIHGGPEGQSRPIFQGRNNFFMSELGVALVFPNVRGSTGYGKTFVKLDNALKREDSVRDIGALLDWIATRPDLDPDRVMITGGSYGGFMTLACATTYDERIRCALDVVGISHFTTFLKNTESYRRDLRRVEYGDERVPEVAEFFERIAPLNNAGRITKPLFVVQGANDPRVPASEAEQMVAKVRGNGGPVWFLNAKDEGHGFRKKPNMDFQFYATVMFVRQHLLGAGSPADAAR
jgi:dipeptidyl aminopeptidase/acylaminoacyl peptidase